MTSCGPVRPERCAAVGSACRGDLGQRRMGAVVPTGGAGEVLVRSNVYFGFVPDCSGGLRLLPFSDVAELAAVLELATRGRALLEWGQMTLVNRCRSA